MKKEKTVKTHTRKTKSGKTVTVKQHTAKYDAAEDAKDIVKRAGAGTEFKKKESIKERFDKAAEELANRPDPKDMTDEEVIKEWKELSGHFGTDHYLHYTERKMRNRDWSKRMNKLRKRYNEAVDRQKEAAEDEKARKYMKSRNITESEVLAYAKKVGYAKNEATGKWHFKGSHAGHPYLHVVQKAVALRKKHDNKNKE